MGAVQVRCANKRVREDIPSTRPLVHTKQLLWERAELGLLHGHSNWTGLLQETMSEIVRLVHSGRPVEGGLSLTRPWPLPVLPLHSQFETERSHAAPDLQQLASTFVPLLRGLPGALPS